MENVLARRIQPDLLGQESLASRLIDIHRQIAAMPGFQPLGRIAAAVYNESTDELKTFAHSDISRRPLKLYSAYLSDVPSLLALGQDSTYRIVNDLRHYVHGDKRHSAAILESYLSSFTLPIRKGGRLYGFLFFNAETEGFFSDEVVSRLLTYAQLLAAVAVIELDSLRSLKAAVLTAREIGHMRDDETGAHLQRMAAYTRIIAVCLAPELGKDDVWVEMLSYFAPLHDIGKVAVPDAILFKPGRLDDEEFARMKQHVPAGVTIVELLSANFGIGDSDYGRILRSVVAYHHETFDGNGYPYGLTGDDIPIEARIVTVADVFDALTSKRPYKPAWPIDEAIGFLRQNSGTRFDRTCVEALVAKLDEVGQVRRRYADHDGN